MKNTKTQYIILPGKITSKHLPSEVHSLLDQAYDLWKRIWEQTYLSNGIKKEIRPDDFFRQSFIPIIKNDTDIIAVHLYSIYNLSSPFMREHSYLKNNFNDHFFNVMRSEKIDLAMSMEALIVNPEYRKSQVSQSYFLAISYLGMKLFYHFTDCDSIIAPVRRDVGIAEAALKSGFKATDTNLMLYNTPVDLVYFKRSFDVKYPNDIIKKQVENLWEDKIVYTHSLSEQIFKAA